MPEVEFDLLERSLDEERGECVGDWPQPGEREATRDADKQLLADADINHPAGMARRRTVELISADIGQHDREARVVVKQFGGGGNETFPHRLHGGFSLT